MKQFIVIVVFIAITWGSEPQSVDPPTVTGVDAEEVQPIIDIIYHPSTDPLTAAALEQMLLEVLGINKPVIIEEPIKIVNNSIIIESEQNDTEGPIIVDEPYVSEANYRPPPEQVILDAKSNREHNSKPEAEETLIEEKADISEKVVVTPIFITDNPDN